MTANTHESRTRSSRFGIPTLSEIFWGKLANGSRRLAEWRKKGVLGEAFQEHRRRAMRLEALEPRLLLSADVSYAAASGVALDAALRIADVDGTQMLQLVDSGTYTVLGERSIDQDIDFTVRGNDLSDRLALDFNGGNIAHQIRVLFDGGAGGVDELIGPDRASFWRLQAPSVGTLDDHAFSGVERVKGGAAEDTFLVLDPSAAVVIDGGAGSDTLAAADVGNEWTISGVDAGTLNNGQSFAGIENVTGGAGQDTFVFASGGELTGTVSGGEGSDTLVGADRENAWLISGANAGTLNARTFAEIENVTGGAGEDTFAFTADGSVSGTISGGEGIDALVGADTVNTWVISSQDAGTLNGQAFAGIENLTGGAGNDTFVFAGGSISGTIDGGAGVNTFDYGSRTASVTVNLETGSATDVGAMANVTRVVGGAGSDTLVGRSEDSTWTISGRNAGGVGAVEFAQIENVSGGSGSDTFVFTTGGFLEGIVAGGLGIDQLVGAISANQWVVDGSDSGTLNGIAFTDVENLFGGDDNDVFTLLAAGGLAGTASGGGGQDRLRGPERKTVWRYTGGGSGDAGGTRFSGMESLEGGSDEDTLVGPAEDSTWTVDGPNSGNVGGVTFSGMENLEGAADNQDTFVFEASGSLSGLVEGGAGGFDSILIASGSFAETVFTISGPDSGTIARDADLITYVGLEPAADATGGAKAVTGTPGADTIVIRDVGGFIVVDFAVGEDPTFTNPATVTSLTINAGDGNDTITIESLPAAFTGPLIINGEGADDEVIFEDKPTSGAYTFDGGAHTTRDKITAVRTSGNFTLTDTSLTADGDTITLANVEDAALTGGGSANTFSVTGWSGTATLDGAGDGDTYNVTFKGSGSGSVTINDGGASGSDSVTVSGTAGADTFNISNTTVSRETESVHYAGGTETLTVAGGGDVDTFNVSSFTGTATLQGGLGDDVVTLSKAAATTFTLSDGSLTATGGPTLTLDNIQVANLTGGSLNDTFNVSGWSGTANLAGAGGNDKYVLDDDWGTVNVAEAGLVGGIDTLDFSLLAASKTLTALADRTRIDSSDGSVFNQTGTLAEEIDVSLIPGFTGAAGDLTELLDDLVAFVERLQSAAGGIDQLINQIPLLNQTGASLAGLLGFTQSFVDLRDELNPIITSVGATPKLSTLIAALNGLSVPAPFTSVNFSTDYRAVDDGDFLDILIDLDFAAHVDETIDLSFGADAESAGISLDTPLTVDVDLTGDLTIGLDLYSPAAPAVFLVPGGTLTLDVEIGGSLGGTTLNLGFLELGISGGTVALDAGLRLTLDDPSNADTLERITLTELTSSTIADLVTVTEDSNPLTPLVNPQTFSVTASLSVDPGVTVGGTDLNTATVNFAVAVAGSVFGSGDTPATPTVNLTADPGTPFEPADDINLLDFSNISPTEALGMLQQVIDALAAMAKAEAMKAQIPFTGGKTLGEVLDFAEVFKEQVFDPLFVSGDALRPDNDGDGAPDLNFSSIQSLVNRLTTALSIGTPLTAAYNPMTQELSFTINFDRVLAFGEAKVSELRPGATGINEQQKIEINATGGTFRLVFPDDNGAPKFTAPINFNAPATGVGSVEAALEALRASDGITPLLSNVTVTKSGNTYTVEFLGNQAEKNVTLLTADSANLTGGLFPLNFGVSLGDIAGVQTTGSFAMAADLSAGLTFGFDLSPSQKIELAPTTYSNTAEVSVERPEGATTNKVQIVIVRNATSGQFKLAFDSVETTPIAFNAPATGVGSVEAALEALAAIDDVTVVRTEVGNHRFYVVTFNTPGDPAALLTAVSAQAPDTPLAGPVDDGRLSSDAHFDVKLFNKPTVVTLTTQEGVAGAPGTNETQRVTLVNATGGTFTLTFADQTTTTIAFNAPATGVGSVQAALEALSNIGMGDVAVVKVGTSYLITFQGALAATNVAKVGADGSKLQSTASIGTIDVTVDDLATSTNTSLTDLRDDVQKAVNTALADAGHTLGFLTGGQLSTGALAVGSVTAAHDALTSFPTDIAFTLKLHLSTGDKEVTGRLRAVDVLDADLNGSLFNANGSLNVAELNAAATPATLAAKLQEAIRTALSKASFGGDGGSGDFNVTVDTVTVGADTRLRINLAAVPTLGDTIEVAFVAPIRVDAGGGRISLATPSVLLSTIGLEPAVGVNRRFEVNTEFADAAFQALGLLSAPTRFDGTTAEQIKFTLVVNGTDVPVILDAGVRTSIDQLVTALQGRVNQALGLAGLDDGDGLTGLVAGDVEVFRVDTDGDPATPSEGNRIALRGKDGVVTKLSIDVPLDLNPATASVQINGAVSELGFVAGTGETRRSKAGEFFVQDVNLSGSLALSTPSPITVVASLGFLEIVATGQGTLGSGKFIDTSIDFDLKNPENGSNRVTVGLLGEALTAKKFLFDATNTGRDAEQKLKTGFVDGEVAGGVGFSLDVEPGGVLAGLPDELNAFLKVTATSPNWLVSLPSFGDPLGLGSDQTDLTATFTVGTAAPANGRLTENATFVLSDGTRDAVGIVLAKDTSTFITPAQLQVALQAAVNAALADLATAGGDATNAVNVGLVGGKFTFIQTAGAGDLSIRGPIAFSGPDFDAVLDRFRDLSVADIVEGLRLLVNFLRGLDGSGPAGNAVAGALAFELPLIDRSIADLVDIAGDFAEKLEAIEADPAGSIQRLEALLRAELGIPDALPPVLSFNPGTGVLGFNFSFAKAVNLTRPFNLDLADAVPDAISNLVSLSASGNLAVSAGVALNLEMGLDLTGTDKAFFLVTDNLLTVPVEGTRLSASLSATGNDLQFTAGLGPFNVFVIDGSASLTAGVGVRLLDPDGDQRLALIAFGGSGVSSDLGRLGDFVNSGSITVTGAASVNLPLFVGTEDNPLPIGDPNELIVSIPSLPAFIANPGSGINFTLPDLSLFTSPPSLFLMLSDPAMVIGGLDRLLGSLQDALNGDIFGIELPLVGNLLANNPAANIIEDFREDFLQPLAQTLRQNNVGLDALVDLIQQTILNVFGPTGPFSGIVDPLTGIHGLLRDQNDDGLITREEDVIFRWLNASGEEVGSLSGATAAQLDFDIGKTFSFSTPPIDLDLGIPALGIAARLQPEITIDFNLHFGFGVDTSKGFYFVTDTNGSEVGGGDPELTVAVSIDFSQDANDNGTVQQSERAQVNGRLLFLALKLTDGIDVDGGGLDFSEPDDFNTEEEDFTRLFLGGSIDIVDPGDDGRLTIPEMVSGSFSEIVQPALTGGAVLRAHAVVDFSTLGGNLGNVLPSISTDIMVDFLVEASPGSGVSINPPQVVFADITLDLGSFVSSFAGPILEDIGEVLDKFDWLIGPDGFLNMRIPLLSDLAGTTITGKDLISFFDPVNGPKVVALLDFVEQIFFLIDLVEQAASEGSVMINFGDLVLFDVPDIDIPNPLVNNPISLGLPGAIGDLRSLKDFKNVSLPTVTPPAPAGGSKTQRFTSGVTQPGSIDFPILKPENVIKLLLGQPDVTLVTVELPEFGFDFFYRQEFPIFGPLVGFFGGGVGGTLDLGFGYDTRGLEQFLATDNPATLLNGFFLTDIDFDTGFDRPEATLDAQITVGAGISLGLVKAGVEGGIDFSIDFNLADLDNDGKVRVGELVANVAANLGEFGPLAPLAIFDVEGIVQFFMRAFLEINLLLTTIHKDFEFVRLTLFEFEIPFERPSLLATQSGGTLTLNIGPNASERLRGDIRDIGETINVKTIGSDVVVWSSQFNVSEAIASLPTSLGFFRFSGVTEIVADGGAGIDIIDMSGVLVPTIRASVRGGDGNDTIRGGAGNDELSGEGGNDHLFGNDGEDTLDGGAGADELRGGAHDDVLLGGPGDDDLFGDGGGDALDGGPGSDDLDGGGGDDFYVLESAGSLDTITGGGTGLDILDFTGKSENISFFLRAGQALAGWGARTGTFSNPLNAAVGSDWLEDFEHMVVASSLAELSTVFGGLGADTFHVYQTRNDAIVTLLDGKEANDTYIFYGEDGDFIDAFVTDNGNAWDLGNLIDARGTNAADEITVTDIDITLAPNQFVRYQSPAATANLLQVKVRGLGGDDDITVASTSATVPVKVFAGMGDDTLTVGDGVVDNIRATSQPGVEQPIGLGPLVLLGEAGHDTVIVDDSLDDSNDTGYLTAFLETRPGNVQVEVGVVSGLGMTLSGAPGRVEFETFEMVDVRLSQGADTFRIGVQDVFPQLPLNRQALFDGFTHTIYGMTAVSGNGGADSISVKATNTLDRAALNTALGVVSASTTIPGNSITNEVQRIAVGAEVGLFTLGFRFMETAPIAFDATALEVEEALARLFIVGENNLGENNVRVTSVSGGYEVEFRNDLARTDVAQLEARVIPLAISGGADADTLAVQALNQDLFFLGGSHDDTVLLNINVDTLTPLTTNGVNAEATLDGETGSDTYNIGLIGLDTHSLVNVFDSGGPGTDVLNVTGTDSPDLFLLRAAAAQSGLAFVALLNQDPNYERVNYNTNLETINILSKLGNDRFYFDDTRAAITVFAGGGDDFFQVGQLYKSQRTTEQAGVAVEDVFATIETTRGWLSNGISVDLTVNAGDGNDEFIVFHNKAVLTANGEAGDDRFLIQAFALVGSQEDLRERTDVSGGADADFIAYAVNAPVAINGGDGFDTVVVVGTEFSDDFVITEDGVFGAGINVSFVNVEKVEVSGTEGDDRFFILGTGASFSTSIVGDLGSDTFFVNGPTPANGVISNDLLGHSGIITHDVSSGDSGYDGLKAVGVSANVADNDEPAIIITQSDGGSQVVEGGAFDTYTVVLARAPRLGTQVKVSALPPAGLVFVEFVEVDGVNVITEILKDDGTPDGVELKFNGGNWFTPQTVRFKAINDILVEGAQSVAIQHKVSTFDVVSEPIFVTQDVIEFVPVFAFEPIIQTFNFGFFGSFSFLVGFHKVQVGSFPVVVGTQQVLAGFSPNEEVTVSDAFTGVVEQAVGLKTDVVVNTTVDGDPSTLTNEKQTVTVNPAVGVYTLRFGLEDTAPLNGETDEAELEASLEALDGIGDISVEQTTDNVFTITFLGAAKDVEQLIPRVGASLVDADAHFPTPASLTDPRPQGLRGSFVTIIDDPLSPSSVGQSRQILSNTGTELTLDQAWDSLPSDEARYEILQFNGLVIPTVEVAIEDSDAASLVVWQNGGETFVAEGSASGSDTIEVSLGMAPAPGETITVTLNGHGQLAFSGDGTLEFNSANYLTPQVVTITAVNDTAIEGFHRADFTLTTSNGVTKTFVANVGDNDHEGVLIIESNGSTDVAEGGARDTYQVVLTQAPGEGETVTVKVTAQPTRTSKTGSIAGHPDSVRSFVEQVEVSLNGTDWFTSVDVLLDADNWDDKQTIHVRAKDDLIVDGGDTQVFAPILDLANNIQGPLFIIGGIGVDRSGLFEREPIMLPVSANPAFEREVNFKDSLGDVIAATDETAGAPATITIDPTDADFLNFLGVGTVAEIDLEALIDVAIEITRGEGKNKVRFIENAELVGSNVVLTLNKAWNNPFNEPGVPNSGSQYTLFDANPNFFVVEADQTDLLYFNDTDNVTSFPDTPFADGRIFTAGDFGRITGLGMGGDRTIGGRLQPGGVSFQELEEVEINLGTGANHFTIDDTHAGATTLNTGMGNDLVDIRQVSGHTFVNTGAGSDTVNVHNQAHSLNDLRGLLTVSGDIPQASVVNLANGSPAIGTLVTAVDAIQRLTVDATGGTFTLVFGDEITADLAFNISAAGLEAALEGLDGIGAGNVEVTKAGSVYRIAFRGALGAQHVDLLAVNDFGLTNGEGSEDVLNIDDSGSLLPTVGVLTGTTLTGLGLPQANEIQSIVVDATEGAFRLSFEGAQTGDLAFNASAAQVQAALEALDGIGTGNAAVTKNDDVYVVRFQGDLTNTDVSQIAALAQPSLKKVIELAGGENATINGGVTVSTRVHGNDDRPVNDVQALTVNATSGSYTLTVFGRTTGPIAFDASAEAVRKALQLAVADDKFEEVKTDVTVDKYGSVYVIGFQGKLRELGDAVGVDFMTVANSTNGSVAVATRMDGMNYYGFETLNIELNDEGHIFNVQGTTAGSSGFEGFASTNVSLGDGDERIFIASNADLDSHSVAGFEFLTGNLDDVLGAINLDTGLGRHRLMISDEAATAGDSNVRITDVQPLALEGLAAVADIWIQGLADGGISYRTDGNFYDGIIYWTGSGDDTIVIDGTHHRAGERTTTILNTGLGDDHVTVDLDDGRPGTDLDGFFVLHTMGGAAAHSPVDGDIATSDDDTVRAAASTLPLIIFGGLGDDDIIAGQNEDVVFGDLGRVQYLDGDGNLVAVFGFGGRDDLISSEIIDPTWVISRDLNLGGVDILEGQADDDILIGGAGGNSIGDYIDGDTGDDLIFGDAVRLERRDIDVDTLGDIRDPRFQALLGQVIYSRRDLTAAAQGIVTLPEANATGQVLVQNIDRNFRNQDGSTPAAWNEYVIVELYHSQAIAEGDIAGLETSFGDDYIAGGTQHDTIFGQLGDDTIQGDGSIASAVGGESVNVNRIANPQAGLAPVGAARLPDGTLDLAESFETADDGDDYIEGNGGADVIFGNLGQDDIIGDNSSLFTLDTRDERLPHGEDVIFGGSGERSDRNHAIDGSNSDTIVLDQRHARDADVIAGDNANIYRLVGINGTATAGFLQFGYDQSAAGDERGTLRIIPRAVQLLDYTPGGPDFNPAATTDIGADDEIHGESGDDAIYGMKGHDVLFGDSDDDDLVGGYGNDWISGGTGEDGVIGDDGRIFTSRYMVGAAGSIAETLYGVSRVDQLNKLITTAGNVQQAIINPTIDGTSATAGQIFKSVDLTPFSQEPGWDATADEWSGDSRHTSDDIIYGGLGSDFLHGGSGDDAISGAEAQQPFFDAPVNPGDVLGYDPTTGTFADYLEFTPLELIPGFLLNFNAGEGIERPAGVSGGNHSVAYGAVRDDGSDKIFGDLGNDWLVGGTGRDNLYGGWGDDLMNADDDHSTNGNLNNQPDTHPTYEDRAFGGAGRDVLIANTGGDRLIDWAGEFNSYLVPFAPFGLGTVSRMLQPQLAEYLYALSRSDGADPTRAVDVGSSADPLRNGEPFGELGLVRQQDFAWHEQTGGPRDPQAGNIGGGKRDVLRSANFDSGSTSGFFADSGVWTSSGGVLQVQAASTRGDAVSVFHVGDDLPVYFEIQASVLAVKPTGGWNANSYLIFDYQGEDDFKFAGIDASTNKLVMGHRDASGWHVDKQGVVTGGVKADKYYNVVLAVNGVNATLLVDNKLLFTHTYLPRMEYDPFTDTTYAYGLNWGLVGVGSNNSRGAYDNIRVQILPPQITLNTVEDFNDGAAQLFTGGASGTWSVTDGRYRGTPVGGTGFSLLDLGPDHLKVSSYLELSGKVTPGAAGSAGYIFDRYADTSFKFVAIDTDQGGRLVIGHYTKKSGWTIDASFVTPIVAGTEHTLNVTLKGTTVSATLNPNPNGGAQAVLGFAFNAATLDGNFGLIATGGSASFDDVRVRTDDPAFAPAGGASMVSGEAMLAPMDGGAGLTQAELDKVTVSAMTQWIDTLGNGDPRLAALGGMQVRLADLSGEELGFASGRSILIDSDAAGYGWSLDLGRMDLRTVVAHEIGHVLGFDHGDVGRYDVMASALDPGVRYGVDAIRIDLGAVALGGDLRLMMEAIGWNTARAASAGLPSFDLGSGPSNGNGSIDWQAPYGDSWGVRLSPYASKPAKSTASNVSDFLVKLFQGRSSGQASQGYDSLGSVLLGDKGKASRLGR